MDNQELEEQMNKRYQQVKDVFLGEKRFDEYVVQKQYLTGKGTQIRLYHTKFTPNTTPKASICIIHGFGEHSGKFVHIADFFCRQGYEVHAVDLRGFGYSGGARGCSNLPKLLLDLQILLEQVDQNLPLFLYGHSMGGLIVLSFALINKNINFAGVIATSPLIGFPQDRKLDFFKLNMTIQLGKKLEDVVINSMVNPTALTKNDNYLQNVFGDRLMIPFLGLQMAGSILKATEYLKIHAKEFNKPLLLVHGKLDSVTNYHDSIYFFEKCSSVEKGLKLFDNGYHELQHDEEYEELRSIVDDWIKRQLDNASPLG